VELIPEAAGYGYQNMQLVIRKTNSVAPEPEGSSPHSREPATGPYPEPGEHASPPPWANCNLSVKNTQSSKSFINEKN
jgi:hypothetical protein